ncbi:MAG: RecX family transcriptional regulator [Lentimicrobiaceae bacterium]|jgi:regulatory protein|nr:RecX family transcriptional regulator [Lentimicrobiaceae bacterium]
MDEKQYELLQKLEHYCSYQERFVSDVITKLHTLGADQKTSAQIVTQLQEACFLDEERATKTFVKSKINKRWGINKIRYALQTKGIDSIKINNVLSEIDCEAYRNDLIKLLQTKKIDETDLYKKQAKLTRYAIQKGYESSLVWEVVKTLNLSDK